MTHRLAGLLAAAAAEGLHLDPATASLDETGADFLVVHGSDASGMRWIVRAPRRSDAMGRAGAERLILAFLGPRLPVAIPDWRIATETLIAYPRLAGDPAAVIDLDAGGYRFRFDAADPPRRFAESFGATLAALHSIDPAEAEGAGLRRRPPAVLRQELRERVEEARGILSIPDPLLARWRRWLEDDSFWPAHIAVVHGDLHPPHILVDETDRVVGLLDWTEAHLSDPAMDFTLQLGSMGEPALVRLLDAYERAGGRVWPRMREHVVESWLAYPVTIAAFARVTGEEGYLALAQSLVNAASLS